MSTKNPSPVPSVGHLNYASVVHDDNQPAILNQAPKIASYTLFNYEWNKPAPIDATTADRLAIKIARIKSAEKEDVVVLTAPDTWYGKMIAFIFGDKKNVADELRTDLEKKYGKKIADTVFSEGNQKYAKENGLSASDIEKIYGLASALFNKSKTTTPDTSSTSSQSPSQLGATPLHNQDNQNRVPDSDDDDSDDDSTLWETVTEDRISKARPRALSNTSTISSVTLPSFFDDDSASWETVSDGDPINSRSRSQSSVSNTSTIQSEEGYEADDEYDSDDEFSLPPELNELSKNSLNPTKIVNEDSENLKDLKDFHSLDLFPNEEEESNDSKIIHQSKNSDQMPSASLDQKNITPDETPPLTKTSATSIPKLNPKLHGISDVHLKPIPKPSFDPAKAQLIAGLKGSFDEYFKKLKELKIKIDQLQKKITEKRNTQTADSKNLDLNGKPIHVANANATIAAEQEHKNALEEQKSLLAEQEKIVGKLKENGVLFDDFGKMIEEK